jgi:TIR domain
MRVFVSHIWEEAGIAAILKEWIESAFPGQVSVFVSSDPADIPAGSRWLDEIDSALQSSKLLITLYSKASLNRPWISFEAGCAWIRQVPIIPICHAGLSVGDLRPPLASFQALDIDDPRFGEKLFLAIAKHINVAELPKTSFSEFETDIRKASAASGSANVQQVAISATPPEGDSSLVEIDYKVLQKLADLADSSHGPIDAATLANLLAVRRTLLLHHLRPLVAADLVREHPLPSGLIGYSITDGGVATLVRRGLLK